MPTLHDLVERVDRLVLRHEELRRTSALVQAQLDSVTQERDSLRSRLGAARARIDALLARLPVESPVEGSVEPLTKQAVSAMGNEAGRESA
jgi:cell division protein ZapB